MVIIKLQKRLRLNYSDGLITVTFPPLVKQIIAQLCFLYTLKLHNWTHRTFLILSLCPSRVYGIQKYINVYHRKTYSHCLQCDLNPKINF